jgi:glycosyltransferase involved in cell wall biosynthesis
MPYLRESINSLLAQTLQDFEILAIDDGSTDGSLAYLQSINDKRVRVIAQRRHGLTFALNRMLSETGTSWLVRHDADDVCYPNRLQLILDYIDKYPDAGMFYSYARYYGAVSTRANFRTTEGSPECLRNITRAGYLLAICHPTVTLNVNKTLRCGAYRFDLNIEDLDLWWRMALQYDIRLIPYTTVSYRLSSGSVSSRNLKTQAINALYVQYLLLSHLWNLQPDAYEAVCTKLARFMNEKHVKARNYMRSAHIEFAEQKYVRALKSVLNGLMVSPTHIFRRIAHEFKSGHPATNGLDPRVFSSYPTLWGSSLRHATGNAPDLTSSLNRMWQLRRSGEVQ